MSTLENFLNEHKNWEEILSAAPYNLKIKKDGEYILFKYNQIDSDFSLDEVREARGSIYKIKDNKFVCVCRPFDKFFNYGEKYAASIQWDSPNLSVTEKIDGSLIKAWWDNDKWHWSTNGSINAAAICISGTETSFMELIEGAFQKNGLTTKLVEEILDSSCTYMFELVGPVNKIVIPYEQNIYYLATRHNEDGCYLDDSSMFHNLIPIPTVVKMDNLKAIVDAAAELDWTHEGFVVYDGKNRIKVKSPIYVYAHHLANNGHVTTKSLINLILMNETEEFLTYYPEYEKQIKDLRHQMKMHNIYINAARTVASEHFTLPAAEYAKYVQKTFVKSFWDFLFKCYRNHNLTWNEYSKRLSSNDWEKILI